ncbi:hypothetical protein [Bacillus badius]|uniref:Group-specific protein n=1 Tax=Bacillus badius TaxID=1455 RepID=A0ABR5AXT2_BACBA|nr:hypothetical protein [Bacillus badius]KIL79544.1 hypothetical protein SD77_1998 [Bacillus badius]MED4718629.1 hypothetical protein [Bacillus badius]
MNVISFRDYMKKTEAALKLENEILMDKLQLGINGLEWLVLQVIVDEDKKKSLDRFIEIVGRAYKKDISDLFADVVVMDPDSFYNKHELNWWITMDEALTYLASAKQRDYYFYIDYLNYIYGRGGK